MNRARSSHAATSRWTMRLALMFMLCANGACGATTQFAIAPDVRTALRASIVPVLLPRLPGALGPIRSIAVISAGHNGYYVGFSTLGQCGGALSCSSFHVAGYPNTRRLDRSYRHDHAVRLFDGTQGFYRPADCSGASCSEASLFVERSYGVYEIDAKVDRDELAVLEHAYRTLQPLRLRAKHR